MFKEHGTPGTVCLTEVTLVLYIIKVCYKKGENTTKWGKLVKGNLLVFYIFTFDAHEGIISGL